MSKATCNVRVVHVRQLPHCLGWSIFGGLELALEIGPGFSLFRSH